MTSRSADDQPQDGKPPKVPQLPPSLDFILKFTAAPSVIMYAVLFIAYRRYYSTLGMSLEDAGINYSYILSRSLGLALLVIPFVALAALSFYLDKKRDVDGTRKKATPDSPAASRPGRLDGFLPWGATVLRVLLLILLGALLTALYSPSIPFIAIIPALVLIGLISFPEGYTKFGQFKDIVRFAAAPMIGATLLATALNSYAHYQASDRALSGCHVRPLEFYGVPILDISATSARIDWIGPREQRPPNFAGSPDQSSVNGLVVGRGSMLSFLKIENDQTTLVQVPANLVTVQITRASSRKPRDGANQPKLHNLDLNTASRCQQN